MTKMKLLSGLILLAGISVSGVALADRGHGSRGHIGIGVYLGTPYLYPYYPYPSPYYYPYSYYPPVVITPAQPPVYIEQQEVQPAPQQIPPSAPATYFWYHCDKPEGYYPYIKECAAGWQKVEPTPPPKP
jgi:hypothetical protein